MSTDRIYIAKDGKSGKHVLVRILAIDDIGANYPPVDSNAFNELMMARDAKSLVLAAQGLGPMFAAKDDLAGRIFIPGELQQGMKRSMEKSFRLRRKARDRPGHRYRPIVPARIAASRSHGHHFPNGKPTDPPRSCAQKAPDSKGPGAENAFREPVR